MGKFFNLQPSTFGLIAFCKNAMFCYGAIALLRRGCGGRALFSKNIFEKIQ
jgi:hypothetical protein